MTLLTTQMREPSPVTTVGFTEEVGVARLLDKESNGMMLHSGQSLATMLFHAVHHEPLGTMTQGRSNMQLVVSRRREKLSAKVTRFLRSSKGPA